MDEPKKSFFNHFARKAAVITGRPVTFVTAVLIIVVWGFLGPAFGFTAEHATRHLNEKKQVSKK